MILLQTVVLAASIALVFVRGSLFKRVRELGTEPNLWREFAGCALCVGQWMGMACAAWFGARDPVLILGTGSVAGVLAFGIHQVFDTLAAVEERQK